MTRIVYVNGRYLPYAKAAVHVEWEEFSRLKLSEGGDLRKYYPLSDEARAEYEAWRRAQAP